MYWGQLQGISKQLYHKTGTTPPKVLENAKTHEMDLLKCTLSSGDLICECVLIYNNTLLTTNIYNEL